jgi:hypothetical protein
MATVKISSSAIRHGRYLTKLLHTNEAQCGHAGIHFISFHMDRINENSLFWNEKQNETAKK